MATAPAGDDDRCCDDLALALAGTGPDTLTLLLDGVDLELRGAASRYDCVSA